MSFFILFIVGVFKHILDVGKDLHCKANAVFWRQLNFFGKDIKQVQTQVL